MIILCVVYCSLQLSGVRTALLCHLPHLLHCSIWIQTPGLEETSHVWSHWAVGIWLHSALCGRYVRAQCDPNSSHICDY